ncbi:hypothetical protein QFC20_004008 [Naganishia adeliensis]|uniref:Uncharacterized protein n=1 Tax=Naganishia adeliensis TaxID=92952 RepID=A0ACC2W6D9_9TREE|nr:hypothetical protein QFC20_004008 [Naganishia adeliensis]
MVLPLEPFPHRISSEVPATAIEKRETAVLAYEKDSPVGHVIWETERPAVERVNQAIRDVLVRKPARFFDVTVQQVEQEDAERQAAEDVSEIAEPDIDQETGEASVTAEKDVHVDGELMTVEEMGQMKMELHQTLGQAWNELNKIAELCRSLIPTQPHPYVLPPNESTASIPAKSLACTLADRAPPAQAVRLLSDTKLAVVQHIDAIKRAQDVLGDGSRRLKRLVGEEDSYWENVLGISGFSGSAKGDDEELREDGSADARAATRCSAPCWALLPRPATACADSEWFTRALTHFKYGMNLR